jgi:membrane-associated phospholipid phosphatase
MSREEEVPTLTHFSRNYESLPQSSTEGRVSQTALRRASISALAFVVLCLLVAFNVTGAVDWWGFTLTHLHVSYPLDVVASLVTLLGGAPITGAIAVVLAFSWSRRSGEQGLVPLLLFVGVAIEAGLKYILPHPGPPRELSRHAQFPLLFHFAAPLFFHLSIPYSFPSGHMLRTTFLAALIGDYQPRWRTVGWMLVCAMAFTLLYLNDHWVSDVGGGILLGLTLAAVAASISARQPPRQRR